MADRLTKPILAAPLLLAIGCTGRNAVAIYAEPDLLPLIEEFASFVPDEKLTVAESDDPVRDARRAAGHGIAVSRGEICGECYRLSQAGPRGVEVRGGGTLGAQYGLAAALEAMGYRFYHPHDTLVPDCPAYPGGDALDGTVHTPEMSRRGLHFHTLHPTEAHFDFWEPSVEGVPRARAVLDWVVKNRGNEVQWMGLDDIQDDPAAYEAWKAHTAAIVAYAHERGLTAGLGVELFGGANLQQAFDLVDDLGAWEDQAAERLDLVTAEGLEFDVYNLSFGEFFDVEPETFLATVDGIYGLVQQRREGVEMVAWIHVGDDLRIEWEDEEILYYFLVRETDPRITRSVHTVMYYDLFDDAGGAYHHESFAEHREFLVDRLVAGEPVNYFPESAYWCAFDSPIPTYLPVYVHSRFRDVDLLAREADALGAPHLDDHVLFTSGWEWGYWQNDVAFLRMSYEPPADWRDLLAEQWAPYGEGGAALAGVIGDLGELQHEALIEDRLAAYMASRDSVMEFGDTLGILSQPRPVSFAEALALDPAARALFEADVLDTLAAFRDETRALHGRFLGLDLPADDPFVAEVGDGLEIDALRLGFVHALYRAVLAAAEGGDAAPWLEEADGTLAEARAVVDRRHAALHDPDGARLIEEGDNATIYDYGYLLRAEELCFWERERLLAREAALGTDEDVPGCAL